MRWGLRRLLAPCDPGFEHQSATHWMGQWANCLPQTVNPALRPKVRTPSSFLMRALITITIVRRDTVRLIDAGSSILTNPLGLQTRRPR